MPELVWGDGGANQPGSSKKKINHDRQYRGITMVKSRLRKDYGGLLLSVHLRCTNAEEIG